MKEDTKEVLVWIFFFTFRKTEEFKPNIFEYIRNTRRRVFVVIFFWQKLLCIFMACLSLSMDLHLKMIRIRLWLKANVTRAEMFYITYKQRRTMNPPHRKIFQSRFRYLFHTNIKWILLFYDMVLKYLILKRRYIKVCLWLDMRG